MLSFTQPEKQPSSATICNYLTALCLQDYRKHTAHICHVYAQKREASHFPLLRQLFITALIFQMVMESEQFLCISVYYSHFSHTQVKPQSWVLAQRAVSLKSTKHLRFVLLY